jgi:hypothetical protein
MRLDEDGFEQLGLVHSLSRPSDRPGDHGGRSVQRIHRGVRGLLRAADRVPFIAVMARATSPAKIALIEREGGRCHLIDDPAAVSEVAARLAAELDGHFLGQFTYAKRATDWRGNNNIAEATLAQMALEPHRIPILDRRRCRNRRHRGGVCAAWESPLVLQPAPTSSVPCPRLRDACRSTAGTIVTLMCDSGARYTTTYDDDWLGKANDIAGVNRPWSF